MFARLNRHAKLAAGTCLTAFGLASPSALAQGWTFDADISTEFRYFHHDSPQPDQEKLVISQAFQAEILKDWLNGNLRLTLTPFVRIDSADKERSHADLREANLLFLAGDWEVLVGITKVFWGALESAHLVDIINQTDAVENIDGEDKLGQPMLRVSRYLPFGTVEGYVMSGFRDRTFAGSDGRLRAEIPVDTDNPEFESSDGRETVEYAARFSGTVGTLDYGVSHFVGNGREPRLLINPVLGPGGQPIGATLTPRYEEIKQSGVDALWALGGWLLKAEGFYREDAQETFYAYGAGAEYTLVGLFRNMDLGLLAEYLFDDRDTQPTLLQNDLFTGFRLVVNDIAGTEILAGVVRDFDDVSQLGLVEASRRLGDQAEVAFEARWLTGFEDDAALNFVEKDDYAQLELRLFF